MIVTASAGRAAVTTDIRIECSADHTPVPAAFFRGRRGRALHLKLCILFARATSEITP